MEANTCTTTQETNRRHAVVHVVARRHNNTDEYEPPVDTMEELMARYPTLLPHVQDGDILEDSRTAGYRSVGWEQISVSSSQQQQQQIGGVLLFSLVQLDTENGDDYGMPNVGFPVLSSFPADYWHMDEMVGITHMEGGHPLPPDEQLPSSAGGFEGYWHDEDSPVLLDPKTLGLPQPPRQGNLPSVDNGDDVVEVAPGGWILLRRQLLRLGGSRTTTVAFLYKTEDIISALRSCPYVSVENMNESLRLALCPDVERGWAIQEDKNISSCDKVTQEQIMTFAATYRYAGRG
jgi:hypothetical protein